MTDNGLEIRDVSTGYGDIIVIRDVSLAVPPGHIYLLLGRNGAGKTTLLHSVAGLLPLRKGEVFVSGKRIDNVLAERRVQEGVSLVQAGKRIFRSLTVEENLKLGHYVNRRDSRSYRANLEAAFERFPDLAVLRGRRAGQLSGGQQQMVAIAEALMPGPSVLMLDEPTAGLAPVIVARLLGAISQLKQEGKAILLVEQAVATALPIADSVGVLAHGRLALSTPASEIGDARAIESLYIGSRSEVEV